MKSRLNWQTAAEILLVLSPLLCLLIPETDLSAFGKTALIVTSMLCMLALVWMERAGRRSLSGQYHRIVFRLLLLIPTLQYASLLPLILPGRVDALSSLLPVGLGLMLIVLGNALPSIEPNPLLGIRIRHTLENRENWIRTSRLSGWVWVAAGLLIWLGVLLRLPFWVELTILIIACLLPIFISHSIWKQQLAAGTWCVDLDLYHPSKGGFWMVLIGFGVAGILMGAVLIFGSRYSVTLLPESLEVRSMLAGEISVPYSAMKSVELILTPPVGSKEVGYAAFGVDLGTFTSDRYGRYHRYTMDLDQSIEIRTEECILIFNEKDLQQTDRLFRELQKKAESFSAG